MVGEVDDFQFIRRYWAEGKRVEHVKDCPVLTVLNLPGDICFSYHQIPAKSSLEHKSSQDTYYLINKGYGTLYREDGLQGSINNGRIIFIEKNKMYKATNDSLTESLEILVISARNS